VRALAIITLSFLLACGQHRTEGKPMEQPREQKTAVTLELALGAPVDNRFGLVVPGLQLTIRNDTAAELEVPETGISMMLSLRTKLVRGAETLERSAGTGKPVTPKTRKLAAGQSVRVMVSPLDDGPGESPLAEGAWTATICLGDTCSNPVSLAVTKR
jgi:hypothetical protein